MRPMRSTAKQFVVCLKNKGYEVSLERRKIYQVLPDPEAIDLPQPIRRAVLAAV